MAKFTVTGLSLVRAVLLATAMLVLSNATDAAARVGVTSATDGDPLGKPPSDPGRVLRVGIDLQANEVITTNANDRAHLVFIDGTSLTVGPNAQLTIDKFVFDPDTKTGDLAINASKGVFRLVGGKISKTNAITITTPAATLGIRGGIMIVNIGPTQTMATFVFGGSMTVSANGQTLTVTRPGSQVITDLGNAPGQPVLVGRGGLNGQMLQFDGRRSGGIGDGGKADQLVQTSGFSNTNSGLIVALLAATSLDSGVPNDAQRVGGQMAAGAQGWQQGLRDYLDKSGGDSGAVVDRARDVFKAYSQDCAGGGGAGCGGDTARQAARVAAGTACAAQVVPVAIEPNYVPPRGSIGYDFQPVGGRTANGFRPVVPGDPRLVGGDKAVADGSKDNLADDSLANVKRFHAEAPGNGEYRIILMGATGQGGIANPFGKQLTINGRAIDVTLGPKNTIATLGKTTDGVRMRLAGTVQAPMLVVDVTINTKELDVQFSSGATVSGLILEPANGISALGPSVGGGNNNTSSEQCSSAEAQIQKAASDGNPPPATPPVPGPGGPPPPGVISGN
jgi:hypothetical protein